MAGGFVRIPVTRPVNPAWHRPPVTIEAGRPFRSDWSN